LIKFSSFVANQLAVGFTSGHVNVLNCKTKVVKQLKVPERTSPVVDLQWDRLSSIYLLVAYESFVSLWDTEAGSEMHVFEKQVYTYFIIIIIIITIVIIVQYFTKGIPISCLAWMDWTSGIISIINI